MSRSIFKSLALLASVLFGYFVKLVLDNLWPDFSLAVALIVTLLLFSAWVYFNLRGDSPKLGALGRHKAASSYLAAILKKYAPHFVTTRNKYIEQVLQPNLTDIELLKVQVIGRELEQPTNELPKVIANSKRLFLFGGPGAGKKIILRRLMIEVAQKQHKQLKGILPVLVQLQDYSPNEPLKEFLRSAIKKTAATDVDSEGGQAIAQHMEDFWGGNLLFLIEGFEKVPQKDRENIKRKITSFMKENRENLYVFTFRSIGSQTEFILRDDQPDLPITLARLLPLSDNAVSLYINRFFSKAYLPPLRQAAASAPARKTLRFLAQSSAALEDQVFNLGEEFIDELNRKKLLELVRTPLYLWLILRAFIETHAIITPSLGFPNRPSFSLVRGLDTTQHHPKYAEQSHKFTEIISTRGQLLNYFIHSLWQKEAAIPRLNAFRSSLPNEAFRLSSSDSEEELRALFWLAFHLLQSKDEGYSLETEHAKLLLSREFPENGGRVFEKGVSLGILVSRSSRENRIDFAYPVLRDFMAAMHIKRLLEEGNTIEEYIDDYDLWEPITLLASTLQDLDLIINKILKTSHQYRGLLAAACLETHNLNRLQTETLIELKKYLHDYLPEMRSRHVARMFERVAQTSPSLVIEVISSRFGRQDPEMKIAMIYALRNMHRRETVELLIEQLGSPDQQVALEAQKALVSIAFVAIPVLAKYIRHPNYITLLAPVIEKMPALRFERHHGSQYEKLEIPLIQQYQATIDQQALSEIQESLVKVAGNATLKWLDDLIGWTKLSDEETQPALQILAMIIFRDLRVRLPDGSETYLYKLLMEVYKTFRKQNQKYFNISEYMEWWEKIEVLTPEEEFLEVMRNNPFLSLFVKKMVWRLLDLGEGTPFLFSHFILEEKWGDWKANRRLTKAVIKDLESQIEIRRYMGLVQCACLEEPDLMRILGKAALNEPDDDLRYQMISVIHDYRSWAALPILLEMFRSFSVRRQIDTDDTFLYAQVVFLLRSYQIPHSFQALRAWFQDQGLQEGLPKALVKSPRKHQLAHHFQEIEEGYRYGRGLVKIPKRDYPSTFLNDLFLSNELLATLQGMEKQFPGEPVILRALADAYLYRANYSQTIQTLRKLIDATHEEQEKARIWYHMLEVITFAELPPYGIKPYKRLRKLIGNQLTHTEVVAIGNEFLRQGDLRSALDVFEELMNQGKPDIEVYVALARLNLLWGKRDRAKNICKDGLEHFLPNPQLYEVLSDVMKSESNFGDAFFYLEQAIQLGLDQKKYREKLEELKQEFQKQIIDRIIFHAPPFHHLTRLIKENLSSIELYIAVARQYHEIGAEEDAIQALHASVNISIKFNFKLPLETLSDCLSLSLEMREWARAVELLRAMEKLFPISPEVNFYRARLALERGQMRPALENAIIALEKQPQSSRYIDLVRSVIPLSRSLISALSAGEVRIFLIKLRPLMDQTLFDEFILSILEDQIYKLALSYLTNGDYMLAEKLFAICVAQDPENAEYQIKLDESRMKSGREDKIMEDFRPD